MNRKYYLVGMLLTAAALVATVVAYPHLPSSVATHWNMHNQANGYSPKWTLFLIGPGFMAGMMLLVYFPPLALTEKLRSGQLSVHLSSQIMLMLVTMVAYFSAGDPVGGRRPPPKCWSRDCWRSVPAICIAGESYGEGTSKLLHRR